MAYGGALLRRWAERPAWVRIPLPPLDGWPSGLRRTPGKRVGTQVSRGFKSHPVRSAALAAGRRLAARRVDRTFKDVSVRRGGRTVMHRSRKPAPSRASGFESLPLRFLLHQPRESGILIGAFTRAARERVSPHARLDGESLPLRFLLHQHESQGFSPMLSLAVLAPDAEIR